MRTPEEIVEKFNMVAHPEGGYYVETHRSTQMVEFEKSDDKIKRAATTAIMFLLNGEDKSHWHMIDADEQWSFTGGSPILLHYIDNKGKLITSRLGNPFDHEDAMPVATVPRNSWFAAEVEDTSKYGLVSCVVSPGFDFAGGFKLAQRNDLIDQYPEHTDIIKKLTKEVTIQPALGTSSHTTGE